MHIYCMHKLIQECASIISNEWERERLRILLIDKSAGVDYDGSFN